MSTDDQRIIDAEVVESEEDSSSANAGGDSCSSNTRNLPAVVTADKTRAPDASSSECIEPNRQDALLADNPERRCVAHRSDGSRCRKFAIQGSTVCRTHGGAVKRIREAARIRVENASNRLMGKLIEIAFDDTRPPAVQLDAIKDSLNRAGLKPPESVVVSAGNCAPYEEIFDSIATNTREESRAARGYDGYPPSQGDWPNTSQPQSHAATAEPYTNQPPNQASERHPGQGRTYADYGETDADTQRSTATRGYEGAGAQGVARQVHHVTGEAALELAARLAEERGLPSPHKRYPRP